MRGCSTLDYGSFAAIHLRFRIMHTGSYSLVDIVYRLYRDRMLDKVDICRFLSVIIAVYEAWICEDAQCLITARLPRFTCAFESCLRVVIVWSGKYIACTVIEC